ncbi:MULTISPECIES: MFS transporter [Bacillus cereus group]|uniref:MFS transporter n=3 Tax=Bacillus thuringiensis TaxID=1428 RepID=A0A1W6WXT5_BACTU|nr:MULTISPECIES: MFS transporter [Bacillus cereus group]MEC2876173.1 MFS transporter [Bacillus cereus]AGG05441.1 MFS permease protein [Bacillus thuringiensis serovar thuringiensis str. IS5056]ARP61341.1 MFS transporter [Bacillus thuringiensis]EEM31530.1 Transporter, MFS superfamily [Bacillus thuringiensis serovar thuringiensis str. T01001]EEM62388.1 Transporter, MFS superfamily [Bacillus thuringiensis serovar berliner ATCC 10792]
MCKTETNIEDDPLYTKISHKSSITKPNLNQQPSMSHALVLLFATACGMSVANIYFAQPLLDQISNEFGINHSIIGVVITITQIFYGLGLLLLVPLGDLLNQRRLIVGQMLLSTTAMVIVGTASSSMVLFAGMALVGLLAVVTQTLVAFAATIASPTERGRVVGIVTSGIVIGILLARTFAGILTDVAGWRSVYLFSAALMLLMVFMFIKMSPNVEREVKSLSYPQLIRSVLALFIQERTLRVRSVLAMLIFADFSILWTSLVLPLSTPPIALSHSAIGAFGLVGVAGALAAARAGKLADQGYGQRTTGIALALLLISWLFISYIEQSLIALVIGIVLLDLAVQAIHVTNQTMILPLHTEARSRLTAGYMVFYSIGSAGGSIASTQIYVHFGWGGVSLLGASVSALALLFWAMTRRVKVL